MSDSPSLSVVWPDDGSRPAPDRPPSELSPEMTLVEFFWQYAWPDCLEPKGNGPRSRKEYVKTLDYWARFTGNPPLREITKRTFSQFIRRISGLPGAKGGKLSPNTVYKHWSTIQRLLEWTGPQSRHNRRGTGLVECPAWIDPPRKHYSPPKPQFTLSEISDWLDVLKRPGVAESMPKIAPVDPAVWWRAMILLFYNTGMRPKTAFGARWEMLDKHILRPGPDIVKGQRGQILYVNSAALAALEPLKRRAGLILRWESWPESATTLSKHRRRIQRAAGCRPLELYALRRTFSTECEKISTIACQLMMNHQGMGTQMAAYHYINAEEVLRDALEKMPQPTPVTQKRLF